MGAAASYLGAPSAYLCTEAAYLGAVMAYMGATADNLGKNENKAKHRPNLNTEGGPCEQSGGVLKSKIEHNTSRGVQVVLLPFPWL